MSSSSGRSIAVLIAGNVLGGIGVASGIAVGALLVGSVGGTTLAGVGQAVSVLGSAIAAVPLARIAAARSRRAALTGG
ncbi:MAG: MFS transporter, partial [Propionibacterium sp.]|nr:MFS transporter [Propionibacterium sp.]